MSKEPPKSIESKEDVIEKGEMSSDAPVLETITDESGRVLDGREAEQ